MLPEAMNSISSMLPVRKDGNWSACNNIAYLKRQVEAPPARIAAAHTGRRTEPERVSANGNGNEGVQEAVVKYCDQASRETWSGRGRIPNWLKRKQEAGEDIEEYLV
jgi:DNA-binding protein H-NS